MSRRLLLSLVVVGLASTGALAAEKKAESDRYSRLVADLGSDDFAAREAALAALAEAGPLARPTLDKALKSGDLDTRRLARTLLERLARDAEADEVLQPRKIRLVYRDAPLSFVRVDFARATGCTIGYGNTLNAKLDDKTITLDTGLTTFWDAYDQLCRAAGLYEPRRTGTTDDGNPYATRRIFRGGMVAESYYDPRSGRPGLSTFSIANVALSEKKVPPLPTQVVGGVRIRALPPTTPLGIWSGSAGEKEVVLALEIGGEPRLGWQAVQSLRVVHAVDDRGQVLGQPQTYLAPPPTPRGYYEDMGMWEGGYYNGGTNLVPGGGELVPARLRLGKLPATKLSELRGVASVKVQTSPTPLVALDNVLKTQGQQSAKGRDGVQLSVQEWSREEDGSLKMRVRVEYPRQENVNGFWGRRVYYGGGGIDGGLRELALYDANGHLVRQVSAEVQDDGSGGPTEYRVTFLPVAGQAEPTRLVWEGRRTVTVDVPFALRDVPLK